MKRKAVSGIMLTLLLTGMLTLAFNIQIAKGWTGTVYIRADGSIDPPDAPIISYDNITYALTDNITSSADGIVVERDNIIIDGAGYTLQGTGAFDSRGIDLWHRNNVTIKNMKIKAFHYGIRFDSSLNSAYGNNITNNEYGIFLTGSSNSIYGNNITNNHDGIRLDSSTNNSISGNNITNNYSGILLYSSLNNSISGNNIAANNNEGIFLQWSSSNSIYHNNFANAYQVYTYESVNVWDDSYPSGGNYWSDYGGSDANGDGIGDTPYVIDADNQDRYPLMHPWSPLPVHNMNTGLGYTTIQEAINAPDTLDRHAIFVEAGTYYEHVVVNKAVRLVGEGRENTIIDGGGAGTCVNMMANDVVINGFTTRNSGNFPDSGIRAHGRVNVTIQNNNIVYNWFGIYLYESSNNTIFHNNFINNTNQVYVRTTGYVNTWDDGYPSGGNYWSDYVGVDVKFGPGQDLPGSDGIGDTPYNIDADNIDHYPLMNPYGAPPPPTYTLTITTTTGGTTNPTPGTYTYTANSSVQVTAIPEANYLFDHWELDTANVGSANSYIVIMDKDHTLKAVFSPIPPPLSASINPLSASINVGQSVTFTSTVSGGHTPYTYQWYLNGALVSGATSNTWTFTPTTSGIYYIHLKVTDAKDNTTQSETARITVAAVPVGGYSIPIKGQNTPNPLTLYLALIAILATVFTAIRRKIPNKKMTEKNKS